MERRLHYEILRELKKIDGKEKGRIFMETKLENGTLVICLEGRVDTNNAAETEREIFYTRALERGFT